jgi:hypothetical protein
MTVFLVTTGMSTAACCAAAVAAGGRVDSQATVPKPVSPSAIKAKNTTRRTIVVSPTYRRTKTPPAAIAQA